MKFSVICHENVTSIVFPLAATCRTKPGSIKNQFVADSMYSNQMTWIRRIILQFCAQ
jgi:hypothetical protein